jgi:hypothetical protein
MADASLMRRYAEQTLRGTVRRAVVEAAVVDRLSAHQIELIEDGVCQALCGRGCAWALAFVAGTAMAPEVIRLLGGVASPASRPADQPSNDAA